MTVIAYRDGIMAADKQSTFQDMRMRTTKLFQHDDWIVGGCGGTAKIREIHEWMRNGMDPLTLPSFQRESETSVVMLLVKKDGLYYMDDSHALIHIEQSFYACGSGRDFAMAAMHMGATAKEAAEIACIYSSTCGMGVDTMQVPGWDGGVPSQ